MTQENINPPKDKSGEIKGSGSYESNCQVCGYYVGASSVCHRCGAGTKTRTSIRTVRLVALIGSIIGVILLWVAAFIKQPDFINIGDITPTMNNALVVIEGSVVESIQDTETNTFRMTVSDNTGNIRINAFNHLESFRRHFDGRLPSVGDTVSVTGALNITQAWGAAMFLSIPERVRVIEKFEMKEIPIGDITVGHSGQLFRISAEVADYEPGQTRAGDPMHRITFRDNTGRISMVLWDNQFQALSEEARKAISRPGSRLKLAVRGSAFRDEPQIELIDPESPDMAEVVSISDTELPAPSRVSPLDRLNSMKIGDITTAHAGRTFKITVTVEEYELGQTRAGDPMHRVTLGDETDIISMVIWATQFDSLPGNARGAFTTKGSKLTIAVEGGEFRGQPQVSLMDASDPETIKVLSVGEGR